MMSGQDVLSESRRRNLRRMAWTVVLGLFLGGLFTRISEGFLPDSAAREFLTTSVSATLGPLSVDLGAVSLALGPLVVTLNVLSLVGIAVVAFVVRSWI